MALYFDGGSQFLQYAGYNFSRPFRGGFTVFFEVFDSFMGSCVRNRSDAQERYLIYIAGMGNADRFHVNAKRRILLVDLAPFIIFDKLFA